MEFTDSLSQCITIYSSKLDLGSVKASNRKKEALQMILYCIVLCTAYKVSEFLNALKIWKHNRKSHCYIALCTKAN